MNYTLMFIFGFFVALSIAGADCAELAGKRTRAVFTMNHLKGEEGK